VGSGLHAAVLLRADRRFSLSHGTGSRSRPAPRSISGDAFGTVPMARAEVAYERLFAGGSSSSNGLGYELA
jgi:hypothetical protein